MKILGTDFVTYYASNFHAAVMFYRDTLALPLESCREEDEWAEFNCGNLTLVLQGSGNFMPGDHAPRLALAVSDLDAALVELRSRGVNIVGEPRANGHYRHMELLDPDGNIVILHQRTTGSPG